MWVYLFRVGCVETKEGAKMKKGLCVFVGVGCMLANGLTFAHQAGDLLVRAGAISVVPHEADHTQLRGLSVNNDVQAGINLTYMLTPQVGLEVLGATPFQHTISQHGNKIGETRHLPPTISLQWHPEVSDVVKPYVGMGVNYTTFFHTKNDLGVKLELSDSTGLVVEAGVDVKLTDRLFLNAAVWKMDIDTDVKVNGVSQGSVELDPFVAMLGLGMRF
ncbi:Outer membrane protein [gamma proteobacterium HdN1]|nr:Outer membrane protein [gamma proteobacterium HdN1]